MSRYELLNNLAHQDLRVNTRLLAQQGANIGAVPAFPTEFAELQREYPIFLRKDQEGGYAAVALLGLAPDENLFLEDERWTGNYLPGALARGPFAIGFQEKQVDGEVRAEPVIYVDVEDPRVLRGGDEGQPLFLPQGGNSPYLEYVANVLRGIHYGVEAGKEMYAALETAGLIRPMDMQVKVTEDFVANITGLHGVDRQALLALEGEPLQELHRKGWLEGAFLMVASLNNMGRLIGAKQRRLLREAGDAGAAQAG